MVLLALLGAWGGQIVHLVLVPHHYCLEHDEISHEHEHQERVTLVAWEGAEKDSDEHCSILGNFLRSGTLNASIELSKFALIKVSPVISFASFYIVSSDLFLLAPKNSPPVRG